MRKIRPRYPTIGLFNVMHVVRVKTLVRTGADGVGLRQEVMSVQQRHTALTLHAFHSNPVDASATGSCLSLSPDLSPASSEPVIPTIKYYREHNTDEQIDGLTNSIGDDAFVIVSYKDLGLDITHEYDDGITQCAREALLQLLDVMSWNDKEELDAISEAFEEGLPVLLEKVDARLRE